MTVDMRRFSYGLAPVQVKASWALDSERVRLAAARKELHECDAEVAKAQGERACVVSAMQLMSSARLDPHGYTSTLRFLLTLDARIAQMLDMRAQRLLAFEKLQLSCAELQKRTEKLDTHRREQFVAFRARELSRAQTVSDADWLQRAEWLQRCGAKS